MTISFRRCGNPDTRAPLPLKRGRSLNRVALAAATLLLVTSSSFAQTGGSYDLTWNTIDGGGATFSTGGSFRVGGTIGQPAAGPLFGGPFALNAGFWGGIGGVPATTPTATRTGTIPSTATETAPPSSTQTTTAVPTAAGTTPTPSTTAVATTRTPTGSPTTSPTPVLTGSATVTETLPPSPSPTTTSAVCAGDCDQGGSVTVDELVKGVNIALGVASVDICEEMDANGDGAITVDELIVAVNRALIGCATG
jgi:hypothetical protein